MKKIAWYRLMQVGMVHLRFKPNEFWELTPAELMLLMGDTVKDDPITRSGLAELISRFPDAPPLQDSKD